MGFVMPVRKCALCLQMRELCDSHVIPAGFYRILRAGAARGNDPVLVHKTTAFLSSDQARAHLLCTDCENRFNRGCEDWVLRNCWRSSTHFPLHAALTNVKALFDDGDICAYAGKTVPGVDTDKLIYFGLSVFWRASACASRLGRVEEERLRLGPYENALRIHLLSAPGQSPAGVALLVTLSKTLDELHNQAVVIPYLYRKAEYRHYKFVVPGLTFDMFLGKVIPRSYQNACSTRRGWLYMSTGGDVGKLKLMETMAKRAERKGKLAATPT